MSRLIVAALCAVLAFPALAEEEKSLAESVTPPASEQNQTPADVEMAKVRAAQQQAASGVPAAPATGQPSGAAQAQQEEPKSSIPLDKRRGGDITQCLEAGDKSDKAINACADKYRPRAH